MLNAIQGIGAGGSRASETSLVAKGQFPCRPGPGKD